jgi:hypothetical protein
MISFAVHQARAGLTGASEDFEQMLALLVRATEGPANLVVASPGDWGIDVLTGDLNGRVTVWQAKYFAQGVARSQQRQIMASFASARKAAADHGYMLDRWVLCIPASMDGPTTQWWQEWTLACAVPGRPGPVYGPVAQACRLAGFTSPFVAVTLRSRRWRSYGGAGSHDSDTGQGVVVSGRRH